MSHIEAYYQLAADIGLNQCLFLDKGYSIFENEINAFNYSFLEDVNKLANNDYVLFANLSIKDSILVKKSKM